MKNTILLTLALVFMVAVVDAQVKIPVTQNTEASQAVDGPKMVFETNVVDYGTIEQDSEPLRSVKFVNRGTSPLVITNARGSCGCTVPKWSKDPIMPGEESTIEVRYSTNRLGAINKKITITTNEGTEPHTISVIGNVLAKETPEGVPASKGTLGSGGN